ncbi:MAG TPA: efflux RND transporter periplasmic adaptor subunit [Gemmatimonadaceae bacterium]|nr:efflux RND transporter periplasmic adaptor subunit [Gemmatimonadaceae bacterium]
MRPLLSAAILSTAALLAACSKSDGAAAAQPGAGGRRAASVTLAQSDVSRAVRMALDEAVAITGDLQPIEIVDVKARLEGDLDAVLVREGERVSRGQLIANFEASEQTSLRRSAEAEQVAARGDLKTAQWNYDQGQELFKAGAIPERDLRVAEQSVATARARLAAADAQVRATSQNEGDTRVFAPTSGVVEKRLVEPGERVPRGTSMFTIVRTDVLELQAAVPARQSNDIRAGQTVHFTAAGRDLDGRVARVSPTVDPASRAVTVYVQVPNAGGAIRGGTPATGRIVLRTVPDALVVPSAAVRQAADARPFVYRIASQQLEPVNIETGVIDEARALTQVASGLREGDQVIIGNVGTLGRGMKVTIIGGADAQQGGGRGGAGNAPGAAPGGASGR